MRPAPAVKLALIAAIVVAAACHDTPTQPRAQSPLVGQWMLTTEMDSFVFVTGGPGPSYPDCPGYYDYCGHQRTTVDGAYLGGVLQVQDSLGLQGAVATSVQAAGTLTLRACDSIDLITGCLHVGQMVSANYAGDISARAGSTATKSLDVFMMEVIPMGSGGGAIQASGATYAGDSIYGRFMWGSLGHGQRYYGSFVLRRVK